MATARPALGPRARAGADLLICVVLALLPFLFFWPLFSTNPQDVMTIPAGDFTELHMPYRTWVHDEYRHGRLPLWNPNLYGGHSAIGDIQFGIFYPVGLLFNFIYRAGDLTARALELQIVVHFSIAAVGMYLLARELTRSRPASVIAAIAFAFGSYLTSFPVGQIIILETSVWLPIALLLTHLALERSGRLSARPVAVADSSFGRHGWRTWLAEPPAAAIGAGVVLATAALVGHPQTMAYDLVVVVAYGLYRVFAEELFAGAWRARAVSLAGILAIAFLAAAVQLLPAYEHLRETPRELTSYGFTGTGFGVRDLLGLVWPAAFGGRPLYVGLVALALAAFGIAHPAGRRAKLFWLGVAAIAIWLSFGGNTFVHSVLYVLVPGGGSFRNHERTAFISSFALALLAAYGARDLARLASDATIGRLARWSLGAAAAFFVGGMLLFGLLAGSPPDAPRISEDMVNGAFFAFLIATTGGIGLLLAANGIIQRPTLVALLVVLLVVDLFSSNWRHVMRPGDPETLLAPTPPIVFALEQVGDHRISSDGTLPGDGNAGSLFLYEDLIGNSPLESTGHRDFEKYVGELERWRLSDVKYIVTKRALPEGALILDRQEGDTYIFELRPELNRGRAFVATSWRVAAGRDEANALLSQIDHGVEVVVEGGVAAAPAAGAGPATAQVAGRNPRFAVIRTESAAPGILVYSSSYAPGWSVTVDGAPATLLRVDRGLLGVELPPGAHTIQFHYLPLTFRVGAIISALTLGLLGLWLTLGLAIRRIDRRSARSV